MSLDDLLAIANDAADVASKIFTSQGPGVLTAKGDRDYASEVDYLIEEKVKERLGVLSPEIAFIGEEVGPDSSSDEMWWVLDPIDGTVNFARGLPLYGVSLALIHDGRPVIGVIDLPILSARYVAAEDRGAFCSGEPLQVSDTDRLKDALISIGDYAVGDNADAKNEQRLHITALLAGEALRVRMLGSAAIDLAWLAHGKTDASITLSNNPWDVSAGVIIAREAGADVFDLDGAPHGLTSKATIATGPALASELQTLLTPLRSRVEPNAR